ncbi:DUF4286 family protein [Devosia ginsengisoli]|uniref:Uncharacterized protein n=1 Tax=Devosia ginsengisoli TaxID=400770 RepID=A0A5B8LXG3_9HYPH|nr:DUF4286 family protein [Devosia ginsengisoli]QDZ12374.1 hypothetical protein FPZ08_17430 [Devosia ginsengisoli]
MTLLGQAVVAIWNGIKPELEDEFLNWHVHEHIPDRVALPGFQRGRRYMSIDGSPRFFNFYEAETLGDVTSDAYMAALNQPTPWTEQVMRHFTQMSRTVCGVAASAGCGTGVVIETMRLSSRVERDGFVAAMTRDVIAPTAARPSIVGVHLLEGQSASHAETAETRLRGASESAEWILLVEAARMDAITDLRRSLIGDDAIIACGAGTTIRRGAYALQFALSRSELPGRV